VTAPAAPSATPALLVVAGAGRAGKSTLVAALDALGLAGVGCYNFDSIGVPSPAVMDARFGSGAGWQAWALGEWVARLIRNDDGVRLAVLDAQVRPTAVRDALAALDRPMRSSFVLVDCGYAERNARLRGPRGQPELATPDMDCFAAYLRGQADALGLAVIDTTARAPADGLVELRAHADALLAAPGA
jgi:hypothetical protein